MILYQGGGGKVKGPRNLSHSDKFLIKLPPPIMKIVFKERGYFYKAFTHYKLGKPLY